MRIGEQPFEFRNREFGESKLDTLVAIEFGTLLLDKLVGRLIPVRFLLFAAVGVLGLAVHMTILGKLLNVTTIGFLGGQTITTFCAMTFNFFVNNVLTYRDLRIRGAGPLLVGLLTFFAVCSLGAVSNVGIANVMFKENYSWWLAGLSGVLVGAVWNYAVSSIFTWGKK